MDLFNITTRGTKKPRPYQEEAIQCLEEAFEDNQSCLMVMATGLGKTFTATEFARRRGGRTMWVAHRAELIEQASDAMSELTGVVPQTEMADQNANTTLNSGNVVASVQTLNAKRNKRKRYKKFSPNMYNTLVTDEAHHAVANSWKEISEHFCDNPELRHLGMTATPDRGDAEALGQVYSHCAFQYDIVDGVQDGWLVPLHIQSIAIDTIDLSLVGKVAGDLHQGQLAHTMETEENLYGVADAVISEAGERRTLIFTSSVKHAIALADIIDSKKRGSSAYIEGKTPKQERKKILDAYKAGEIQFLCNVGIATEGFDVPNIGCVAIARPTMSRSLYTQMIGRGTRPLAGAVDGIVDASGRRMSIEESRKPNVIVMDFVGNSGRHKLVSAADVLGGNYSDEAIQRAVKISRESGEAIDTIELLKRAEEAVKKDAKLAYERRMRRQVESKTSYRSRSIDPFDLLDIDPPQSNNEWNAKPLTHNQMEWLERSGFDTALMSPAEQRTVLNNMINRKIKKLATPKQLKVLKRYGYQTQGMSFDNASALITRLANNNWKKVGI